MDILPSTLSDARNIAAAAAAGMNLVCQQCKQPLQLDPSIAELDPSAYDMLAASLPQSSPKAPSTLSTTERISQLSAPSAVKQALEQAHAQKQQQQGSSANPTRPLSHLAARPKPESISPPSPATALAAAGRASGSGSGVAESFVVLQDSVVQKIPASQSSGKQTPVSASGPSGPSTSGHRRTGSTSSAAKRPTVTTPTSSPRRKGDDTLRPTSHSSGSSKSPSRATQTGRSSSRSSHPNSPHTATPPPSSPIGPRPPPSPSTVTPSSNNNTNSATPSSPTHRGPSLSHTLRLFNLLSSRTELDHPLCAECTHILVDNLSRKLEETKKERDGYIAFEKEIKREREREKEAKERGEGVENDERIIEQLKIEEKEVLEELKAAEAECATLEEELAELEREEQALEEEEAEFWQTHNQSLLNASRLSSELLSLQSALTSATQELEKLSRTNVYNDAFCIGHDDVFGTINGLRLGKMSGVNVDWPEINAAWGQTLLLLYTIARKLNFTFENYRLVPMGSFSKIEKTTAGDKGTYELYGSGDFHLSRVLQNRRFNTAMISFLDCIRQLMEHVKSLDPSFEFPHTIVKDRIGDVSIKLQFNQEESWTNALRHMLLALKFLLKWATSNG